MVQKALPDEATSPNGLVGSGNAGTADGSILWIEARHRCRRMNQWFLNFRKPSSNAPGWPKLFSTLPKRT